MTIKKNINVNDCNIKQIEIKKLETLKYSVENIAATRVLTVNDSGKLFIIKQSGTTAYTITLPSASHFNNTSGINVRDGLTAEELKGWNAKFILGTIGTQNVTITRGDTGNDAITFFSHAGGTSHAATTGIIANTHAPRFVGGIALHNPGSLVDVCTCDSIRGDQKPEIGGSKIMKL